MLSNGISETVGRKNIPDFDVIFHLAAFINVDESIEFPYMYMENNTLGTLNVLEYVKKHPNVKLIFASSAEVYGSAQTDLISEEHLLNPASPYAVSKLSAEQLCKNYVQLYGLDVTIIRNFNTFGEYQSGGKYGAVIAKFKELALRGSQLEVYGSGEQIRDYMHISQAVEGYVLALNNKLPMIINFGSGNSVKIIDIAKYIANKFGVGISHTAPRPGEIMRLQADISCALKYGYKASTDFWNQLERYLEL